MACYSQSHFQGGSLLLLPVKHSAASTEPPFRSAIDLSGFASRCAPVIKVDDYKIRRSINGCGAGRGRWETRAGAFSSSGDLRPQLDENPEGILSGEWPENFSLLSYEDFRAYLQSQVAIAQTHKMRPCAPLREVMSTPVRTVTADLTLEEVQHLFEDVSGLPVVDGELRCIGVVTKEDRTRASHSHSRGLKAKVTEVMSSPAITLSPDKTVTDAAALMLKKKIHTIPVINEEGQVVGIVTRTDVYQALQGAEV